MAGPVTTDISAQFTIKPETSALLKKFLIRLQILVHFLVFAGTQALASKELKVQTKEFMNS